MADFRGLRIHMIGVGGSGMAGVAAILLRAGARISGSDARMSITLARLAKDGALISTQQRAESLPVDAELIVASAAIADDHPELAAARKRGLQVLKYSQMLGLLMAQREGVAISGTHGKSTTTAWLALVLREAGLDPSFVVGASVEQLDGSSGVGDGPHFIAEACEYARSFLNLKPRFATILNIEADHLDYYPSLAAITGAFTDFAASVRPDGLLVVNGDDERCRALVGKVPATVQTCGLTDGLDWHARDLRLEDGCYSYELCASSRPLGRVTLSVPGLHNVRNSLAVVALATACGVDWVTLRRHLAAFRGARRRLELRGEVAGVRIVDDYAHHPTEIRASLRAARERFAPRRLWCVFQPHQYSRTRLLLDEFVGSFDDADHVILPDIYAARDSQADREAVSSARLAELLRARGRSAVHIADFDAIIAHLSGQATADDLVMTMGAGNIGKLADDLVQRLGGDLPA